jgi:hypothetical protein
MWRVFNEEGHAYLMMAEYQGDVIASSFVIDFDDTVVSKMGGWLAVDSSIRAK